MRSRRPSRVGAGLFAVYAIASLVPVAVLGAVLVRGYHDSGVNQAMDQGRAQAAVIEQMAIAPAIEGVDLSQGLDAQARDRLHMATDLAIFHGSVVRLRLLTFDGAVAFSDDGSVRDAPPVDDPTFRKAANGQVDTQIVDTGDASSIRVLQPVVAESNGRAIGVLELYLPYDTIAAKVQANTSSAIQRLALGLLGLYFVMALVSWWTTKALRRHAADHEHQALHDPLTGLPNRELFRRAAEEALVRSRTGDRGALVLVDLDHFKEVNDTLGHHAGDELLTIIAGRLTAALRTDDVVARLGGDEFGMLLPTGGNREETVELLTRVRREVSQEVVLGDATLSVEASFGVCFYPDDASTVEGLLQNADAAMYHGKRGPTGVVVYEPTSPRAATDSLSMQRELRRALECDEFVLHYQPKIDLSTGRTSCVEALIRWQHPLRGLLPPSEFLPVAERSELIEPLTTWVLERALRDHRAWTAAGHDWTVAVNISARNLSSLAIVDTVGRLLDEFGVPPERLMLEITETAIAHDTDLATRVVAALRRHGVTLSVDDFGTGFTVLSQLRTLAVAEIKIDRLFIVGLVEKPQDRAIVRSVIDLGHQLGCMVTAEGVESPAIAEWLVEAGCDHAQGYLWQRPVSWPDVIEAAPAGSFRSVVAPPSEEVTV